MINDTMDWRADGACLAADPDLFFPVSAGTAAGPETSRALQMCGACPVRRKCLDFAMQTGEVTGIWGGTTPDERVSALRSRGNRRPGRRGTPRRVAHEALVA